ncbi:VOC family protein [Robiginitalea sp. IMCC43444]|uniref:VOC family protein n=1 Tax=Robiginitalea sp. IMCC43444 TaxID=3459121 RepID=UPI0040411081
MRKVINGIQQVGLGVRDATKVFNWYRRHLGFDVLLFRDRAVASLMTRYTGGVARDRLALLALNLTGGGGLEIWQCLNQAISAEPSDYVFGDLGINVIKLRCSDIHAARQALKNSGIMLSEIQPDPRGRPGFFGIDPWNNRIQVIEDPYCFYNSANPIGGVLGVSIGVSDMEKSLPFYKNILNHTEQAYDIQGSFKEFEIFSEGDQKFRRVLLKSDIGNKGGFSELLGPSEIELFQPLCRTPNAIFKDRFWGDEGLIHLCFDIQGMQQMKKECEALGHPFTVDSSSSFKMEKASGHFSYIEDPDGTLIELVETHRVPIVEKLGLYIDLSRRNPLKPLPRWLVKTLRWQRRHKDL